MNEKFFRLPEEKRQRIINGGFRVFSGSPYRKCSMQEIADAVGFKTASAVNKHIAKIAGAYEDFVSDEYGSFLDKHIK